MTLPGLQLVEPIVTAIVALLSDQLAGAVNEMNASIVDGFTLDPPAQILPYVPVPSSLEGGMPCVGVQRMGGEFQDDLQYSMDAEHDYAIVATVQNSDHQTLVWQLDRYLQCIAYVLQQDRLADNASVLRTQGQTWSVGFKRYEPGPLLGDMDPTAPEAAPRSYISFVGLVLCSKRTEV